MAVPLLAAGLAAIAPQHGSAASPGCEVAIDGTLGPDRLEGGPRSELIRGFRDRDVHRGRGGPDCMRGGRGRDRLLGGRGGDLLHGGPGRDRARGSRGKDELLGSRGGDRLAGGRGRDRVLGGRGADVLSGGNGRDLVSGGRSADLLRTADGFPDEADCGPGEDEAVVDARDSVTGCERVDAGDETTAQFDPALGLPAWGDGIWHQPAYYSTIQTANLDGDASGELIGRGIDGLQVHDFDSRTGQWEPVETTGGSNPFTDAGGWDAADFYSTIQTADLEGDGIDEILGRGFGGIVVYSWHRLESGAGEFVALNEDVASRPFTNSQGWSRPEYYATIQSADLDGDGAEELLGRSVDGIDVFGWRGAQGLAPTQPRFVRLNAGGGPFTDAGGWDAADFYSTIQTADLAAGGGAELIGRGSGGIDVWQWRPASGSQGGEFVELNADVPAGPFTNSQGWSRPEYYATIQSADLDGDGAEELLGRSVDGIDVFGWRGAQGLAPTQPRFVRLNAGGGPFTDAGGWDQTPYYETIQSADLVDGGGHELIGRSAAGIQVWQWRPGTGSEGGEFVELNAGVPAAPFADANGWDDAMYFATIQAADIAGDAGEELLGRGATGMQTWTYGISSNRFSSPSEPFPAYTGGEPGTAYAAINRAIGGELNPGFDIRSQYGEASGAELTETWPDAIKGLQRPAGVSAATWEQVRGQVLAELGDAALVQDWFDDYQAGLINDVFTLENMDSTADAFEFRAQEEARAEIEASTGEGIEGVLIAMAIPLGEETEIVATLVGVALAAGGSSASSPNTQAIDSTYLEIRGRLQASFQDAIAGNTAAKQGVMADYGLLTTVGALIDAGVWSEPPAAQGQAAQAAALRSYSAWVTKIIARLEWRVQAFQDPSTSDWVNPLNSIGFVLRDPEGDLSAALRGKVFDAPGDGCLSAWDATTCSLGQPGKEVFCGWGIDVLSGVDYTLEEVCNGHTSQRRQ